MEMQDTIQTPTQTPTLWEAAGEAVANVGRSVHVDAAGQAETPVREAPVTRQVKNAVRPTMHSHKAVPQFLAFPYTGREMTTQGQEVTDAEVGKTDSIAVSDSTKVAEGESMAGIILVDPAAKYSKPLEVSKHFAWGTGMSLIYLALVVLFCAIAFKFKGSKKYMKALYKDLVDTRVRHNLFDDTVRETSLLVLLNMLWVVCFGVLLWAAVRIGLPYLPQLGNADIPSKPGIGIGMCIGVSAIYMGLLLLAYWVVGSVFSDRNETRLWFKGAASANALETFILFPCALLTLTCPYWSLPLLAVAAAIFLIGKIVFLYKGFRIFFNEISSWLLFLYYLCSLEIIPLLLTYVAAVYLCSNWL